MAQPKTPDHEEEFASSLPVAKTPDHDAEFMSSREAAESMADDEFELDVGNQVGPLAAQAVDASKADVIEPIDTEKFPLYGMYVNTDEDMKEGDTTSLLNLFGEAAATGQNPIPRGDMNKVMKGLAEGDVEMIAGNVYAFGQPALESSKFRIADTFAHEFVHRAANKLGITELNSEENTQAYVAWRANSPAMFNKAMESYVSTILQKNPDLTYSQAHQEAEKRLMTGGVMHQLFTQMEGRMLRRQDYPLPEKFGSHKEMSEIQARERLSRNMAGIRTEEFVEDRKRRNNSRKNND